MKSRADGKLPMVPMVVNKKKVRGVEIYFHSKKRVAALKKCPPGKEGE